MVERNEVQKFEAAVRRVRRLTEKLAVNEVEAVAVRRAIEGLYNRLNGPELRANAAEQEARFTLVKELTAARIAAEEAAYEARVAGRNKEIARLTIEIARRANARPY